MKRRSMLAMAAALCICGTMAGCGSSSSGSESKAKSTTAANAENISEAATEAATEKQTEAASESAKSSMPTVLTDNLFDYCFSVGGNVVGLPATYKDLKDAGWVIKGDKTSLGGGYDFIMDLKKDNCQITVKLMNNTDENADLTMDEGAAIVTVTSILGSSMWNDSEILAPKNIIAGVSTEEDVVNAYGEPKEIEETEKAGTNYIYYEGDKVDDYRSLNKYITLNFRQADSKDKSSPVVLTNYSISWKK